MTARVRLRTAIGASLAAGLMTMAPGVTAIAAPLSVQQLLARERPVATKRIPYGALPSQFGELWLPAGAGRHRVVILIHGGCWSALLPGHEMMAYMAEDLRARGNAVWNIEYRRLGEAGSGYPGTFNDIAAAVDQVKALAKIYPLDLGNVVAVGHSAGGHFALWAAARSRLPPNSLLARENPLRIKGAVSLAGIGDLKAYAARGPGRCSEASVVELLINATARWPEDVFADTSPAAMLPSGVPQIVITGADDPIVPPGFGRHYSQLAAAAGDKVEEITIPGASHFELIDPQAPAFAQVVAAIERLQK
jgi:acetyl esterase/lipase